MRWICQKTGGMPISHFGMMIINHWYDMGTWVPTANSSGASCCWGILNICQWICGIYMDLWWCCLLVHQKNMTIRYKKRRYLVGGAISPSWKMMELKSVAMMTFHILWNMTNIWNHQPDTIHPFKTWRLTHRYISAVERQQMPMDATR